MLPLHLRNGWVDAMTIRTANDDQATTPSIGAASGLSWSVVQQDFANLWLWFVPAVSEFAGVGGFHFSGLGTQGNPISP
jgi:hypothetical protein